MEKKKMQAVESGSLYMTLDAVSELIQKLREEA